MTGRRPDLNLLLTFEALEFLIAVSHGRASDVMHLLDEHATWWVNGHTRLSGSWPVPELPAQAHAAFASGLFAA